MPSYRKPCSKTLGERIEDLRKERKLTQKGLAQRIGTTSRIILRIEKGGLKSEQDIAEKLANYFQVSINWLVRGEEYDPPKLRLDTLEQTLEIFEAMKIIDSCRFKDLIHFILHKYPNFPKYTPNPLPLSLQRFIDEEDETEDKETLGERVKRLREKKELTQEKLALDILTSPTTIIQIEQGELNPDTDQVSSLARAFRVSVDRLITGEEYYPPNPREDALDQVQEIFNIMKALDKEQFRQVVHFVLYERNRYPNIKDFAHLLPEPLG